MEVKNIYWKGAFWCWALVLCLMGVDIAFILIVGMGESLTMVCYTVGFKILYLMCALAFVTVALLLVLHRKAYPHI